MYRTQHYVVFAHPLEIFCGFAHGDFSFLPSFSPLSSLFFFSFSSLFLLKK